MSWKWAKWATMMLVAAAILGGAAPALAQTPPSPVPAPIPVPPPDPVPTGTPIDNPAGLPDLTRIVPPAETGEGVSGSIKIMLLLTVLTLAPAILVLMTSFTRIIIVLSLLRQAMATQNLPPNQILIGLSLLMTFLIMSPVWQEVNSTALQPYLKSEIKQDEAFDRALVPVRGFMIRQIENAGNQSDVRMFLDYAKVEAEKWSDVPTNVLVPAFVTSELKVAFLMGFKLYLPFLIIDMVIASILISMGMLMLPPVLISLPFKILLFVMVNGWHLVVGSLLNSFG